MRWGKWASLDPGGLSAAGPEPGPGQWQLVPLAGLQRRPETFTCRPVHIAPVLNGLGKGCSLWSVLSGGGWGW